MKIKANTPYEIKYFFDKGEDKKINIKSHDEVLNIILQNAQIKREEYDDIELRKTITIENIAGGSVSLEDYVINQIDSYYNDIEEMEKELNESFVITYVVPKNDYESEDDFFLSDEEKIEKIRNHEKFRGFAEITEQTNEEKFFIGKKIDEETQKQQTYYVKLIHAFGKDICLIDTNKDVMDRIILRDDLTFTTNIILDPTLSETEFIQLAQQVDELSFKYPIMTVIQYESYKAQNDAIITVDENNNIKINTDALGIAQMPEFKDVGDFDADDYSKIDGKWVKVGKLQKNVLVDEEDVIKFDETFDMKNVEDELFKTAMNENDEFKS